MFWPFVANRRFRSLLRRAWPSRRSSRRREGLFGSSIIIEASERNGGWASCQLEELEQRKVLAVDVDLTGTVLTVAFDDAADDAITLSINSTGFFTSGGQHHRGHRNHHAARRDG